MNSKFKIQNPKPAGRTGAGLLAVLLTSVLHAGVIAGLMLAGGNGAAGKTETINKKEGKVIPVSLMVLPKVEKRGQKSVLKEKKSEKKKPVDKEEFGSGSAREARHGENAEEEMLVYKDMIKQKLQEARNYPQQAKWKGLEGSAGVAFIINGNGTVKSAELYEESGAAILNREALKTVERASPFPPVPGGKELKIHVAIIFKLN